VTTRPAARADPPRALPHLHLGNFWTLCGEM